MTTEQKNTYVNVTQNFLVWFEFGFILQFIAAALIFVTALTFFKRENKVLHRMSAIICSVQSIGAFAWSIVGYVFLWRQSGNICTMGHLAVPHEAHGEHTPGILYQSGMFIFVMNIIHSVLIGAVCCYLLLWLLIYIVMSNYDH